MYLHPQSLSPDPTYGRKLAIQSRNGVALKVYPHRMLRASPVTPQTRKWAAGLDLHRKPPRLQAGIDSRGRFELVIDFGTELDAELHIGCSAPAPMTLCVFFGESEYEAEGFEQHTRVFDVPAAIEHRFIASQGRNDVTLASRGFRFVKIVAPDAPKGLVIESIEARASFAGAQRLGDLCCSDKLFQQVWQTSVYTARLCTRSDGFWDGVKRDRLGWYGDARITHQAADLSFFDSAPSLAMLHRLPVNSWANDIPLFSFDAIAMLKQIMLTYGLSNSQYNEIYKKIRAMLTWAEKTHSGAHGLLSRSSNTRYFFDMGFIDWSPMPLGGRFEELGWLQCRWIEAFENAGQIALWLRKYSDAARYRARAARLRREVDKRFFSGRNGFVHTLNQTSKKWEKLSPSNHYDSTYVKKIRLGPSGPSRHSSACAVLAGLHNDTKRRAAILAALNNPKLADVITPYFVCYEQQARAACGDPDGALVHMRDYVGQQIAENDSATVWESFEPEVKGFQKFGLHGWPKSLCHGWGSGIVPLASRWLLGVEPTSPGYSTITLEAPTKLPWTFSGTIPTPQGIITVTREKHNGPITYQLPKKIKIDQPIPRGITINQV